MDRKGTGYAHEMLLGLFILIIAFTFYAQEARALIVPIVLMVGGIMILGGLMTKEPLFVAGGMVFLAFALMYSQVVL
jgi:hypothetical protein